MYTLTYNVMHTHKYTTPSTIEELIDCVWFFASYTFAIESKMSSQCLSLTETVRISS